MSRSVCDGGTKEVFTSGEDTCVSEATRDSVEGGVVERVVGVCGVEGPVTV